MESQIRYNCLPMPEAVIDDKPTNIMGVQGLIRYPQEHNIALINCKGKAITKCIMILIITKVISLSNSYLPNQ